MPKKITRRQALLGASSALLVQAAAPELAKGSPADPSRLARIPVD